MMEIVMAMFIFLIFGMIMCIAFLFTRSEEKETFEQAPPPKAETAHYLTDKYSNCDKEQAVYEIIKEQTAPISTMEIATLMGITTRMVSALCRKLMNEGKIKATEIHIRGKGITRAYSLA